MIQGQRLLHFSPVTCYTLSVLGQENLDWDGGAHWHILRVVEKGLTQVGSARSIPPSLLLLPYPSLLDLVEGLQVILSRQFS